MRRLVLGAIGFALVSASIPSIAADRYAGMVRASMMLDSATVDLLVDGSEAALRITEPGQRVRFLAIVTPDDALGVLADRRAAPLWPALLAWAGPTLEGLRDRRIAQAQAAVANGGSRKAADTATSSVRPPVRAAMALAAAMRDGGRVQEAAAVLNALRPPAPTASNWGRVEWTILTARLANNRYADGDTAGALALLRDGETVLGRTDAFWINMAVNRAAYLAETGRFAESLALVEEAQTAFDAESGGRNAKGQKVPGSDRQFAWIRACAASGLARTDRASTAALRPTSEPRGRGFVIEPSDAIRYRYAQCIDDAHAAAEEMIARAGQARIGSNVFAALQPGLHEPSARPGFVARVRNDADLVRTLGPDLRILPPEFTPALNHWRPR